MKQYNDFGPDLGKYIGSSRKLKCPTKCPECGCLEEYVSDYITHRGGYHSVPEYIVKCDLERILNLEEYGWRDLCCCSCNCCCKKDCCEGEDTQSMKNKLKLGRLERALQDINHELSRIRSEIC